jgi:alpha-beta hydrolase superfamily lysophospholipase
MNKGFGTAQGKEPAGTNEDRPENAFLGKEGAAEEQLPPAAIVIFIHGYCVHARYEALLPEYPGAPGHDKYEGSVTHRLNEVGCDVLAFDLQGHGLSDKIHGQPCYVEDFDDFAKDVIQFIRIVKEEYRGMDLPPLYLLGASMGGLVALRTTQLAPDLASGLILLAPAIMMLDEADPCCWYWLKLPILQMMKPILGRVRMIHRYRALDEMMKQTEGTDPLNFWGLMHFGMASNMAEGQSRTRSGPQITCPYIILSSPNDTHVNSQGPRDMYEQTTSKDKTLCWMNSMGHSLLYEPPGCENVVNLVVDWVRSRATPGSGGTSAEVHLNAPHEGYTIKRSME